MQLVRDPTHDGGGLLDWVIGPCGGNLGPADVSEVGLSDHKLVHWEIESAQPCPEYKTITRRRWASFDKDQFVDRILASELFHCVQDPDVEVSASEMAENYHRVISNILDELAPVTTMSVRLRPHRLHYDQECRQARRTARRLERAYLKAKRKVSASEADAFNTWRTALRSSRRLVRTKGRIFWRKNLESVTGDSKKTWRNVDMLLGKVASRPHLPLPFTAEEFHRHLDGKIAAIRERTANAEPAEYTPYAATLFEEFHELSTADVVAIIRSAPNKQCPLDPLPVWLLKEVVIVLAPFLTKLLTASMATGEFPVSWKHAQVLPHLKCPDLDPALAANYRPVSNLPFLSKVLERAVNKQLVGYLVSNGLFPRNQSAYRRGHSTETALLRIFNYVVDAISNGRFALLCLLDLSSAFDTVDHGIMIRRLECSYGFKGKVLTWLSSYLADRTQSVRWHGQESAPRRVLSGVPQGSVLGPLLFVLYVADIGGIISSCGLEEHAYADDVQLYSSCSPAEVEKLQASATDCITKIKRWTDANRLALNSTKTELLWFATPRRAKQLKSAPFLIDGSHVLPSSEVRLLGVYLDGALTFDRHIGAVARTCHYHLRRIREIRHYLPISSRILLSRALILSRTDYCNSVLWGLPDYQLSRLQRVINASARMIFGARYGDHISLLLKEKLHWLRIPERVAYKRCALTFRALHDTLFPENLAVLFNRRLQPDTRMQLRSSREVKLVVPPPSRTVSFGERSVTHGNPILWNALPSHVTSETNIEQFLRKLKTFFFEKSFGL